MTKRTLHLASLFVALSSLLAVSAFAQRASSAGALSNYLPGATPILTAPLTFPGPGSGYTFLHLPVREVDQLGDTVVNTHAYLLDCSISQDGIFLTPDTIEYSNTLVPFVFPAETGHVIHARLAPTHIHEEYRMLDSTFGGAIGYGLLQKYTTAFDFIHNQVTFYPLLSNVDIPAQRRGVLTVHYLDDAFLTFCHCMFPTMWLEATAPPLKPGRIQIATQQPSSQIFESALDSETFKKLTNASKPNSFTGRRAEVGLSLAQFIIGGHNIAGLSPHRLLAPLPPEFHDLSVTVMGTLGTDVLRAFAGMIIDPGRKTIYFFKR